MHIRTLSWRRPLWYRNKSIDLQSKSVDWFLYNGLRHERVKDSYPWHKTGKRIKLKKLIQKNLIIKESWKKFLASRFTDEFLRVRGISNGEITHTAQSFIKIHCLWRKIQKKRLQLRLVTFSRSNKIPVTTKALFLSPDFLRSQETFKSSHLKNVFFLLYILEAIFGYTYTKFWCLQTSDNDIIWLKIFKCCSTLNWD